MALRNAAIGLLACLVLLVVAIEAGARIIIYRVSANLSRIHQESVAASQIRADEAHRHVLFLGNSLLLHDVDILELDRRLQPRWTATRFAIEQTAYYDWYFGVRGLLAQGAHPDVIVLCLEARHLIMSSLRNEVFAYYLMQRRDLLDVSRTLDLSASDTVDLLFANTSVFYALRKEIRQVVLQRIISDLPALTGLIARSPKPPADPNVLRTMGRERLVAIRDLAASSNIQLIMLVAPPLQPESAEVFDSLSLEIGIPVLMPLDKDKLKAGDYLVDGYHLNESGRKRFTEALVPLLREALGSGEG